MLQKLMKAAQAEDWELVDKTIPKACKDQEIVEWAFERGLENPNKNIRDLAASILEKAKIATDKFQGMREKLHRIMVHDKHPYARYRSAFALAAHGAGNYREDTIATLKKAEKDEDVSSIASSYLKRIYSE